MSTTWHSRSSFLALGIAVLATLVVRLLTLSVTSLNADEAHYAACVARIMAVDEWPIVGCREIKPPGIFLVYQVAFGLTSPYDMHGVRVLGMLFVWLFNNQKFRGGIDAKAPLLSRLSQTRNIAAYFMLTLVITVIAYAGVHYLMVDVMAVAVPVILFYQTVNFHHYIVDAMIWKARKKPIQKVLALSES